MIFCDKQFLMDIIAFSNLEWIVTLDFAKKEDIWYHCPKEWIVTLDFATKEDI